MYVAQYNFTIDLFVLLESATGQGNTVEGNEEINEDNENVTSKGE